MSTESINHQVAKFASELSFEQIPDNVILRCEELLLDTLGSIYAGSTERPVKTILAFAQSQGPLQGSAQLLPHAGTSSPYFAAMVNAAASHMVEQDDLHNSSVFHPACVVFPPALAIAQSIGASGKEFLTACVVGYEIGIRVGEFLGRSHYKIFHTTATAGTIAAAATVGNLLKLTPNQMLHALGSAGTQAAGLWEFLLTAADSKQLHTAKAAANGLMAAMLAKDGFTGAEAIFDGKQGMGVAFSESPAYDKLNNQLGTRWALLETSFKYHASCRHTHPAADALLSLITKHDIAIEDIVQVTAHVHQAAIDVLGAVNVPTTVHQSKFSMGTVLGIVAYKKFAGLTEFDEALNDPNIHAFREKVHMVLDKQIDDAYPNKWLGKVTVTLNNGKTLSEFIEDPKGDPGNTLSRPEIEAKVTRLMQYRGVATVEEIQKVIQWVWELQTNEHINSLL
ncbi:MmgE/PrpD family protein [Pelistega sp. MC2]|uniref:MmgE/PrpD family protein n=1 Tax=Pelistega sp. MC2 TaxID=1720297 RepID=UPI0008D97838|nr:MmgE/PrpD family protein [Pelistega sp. MC2]